MMGRKVEQVAFDEPEAVDYRSGTPWDFGLLPEVLRRVAACTKARVKAAEVPFGGNLQPS
jgi:hypothetical protein